MDEATELLARDEIAGTEEVAGLPHTAPLMTGISAAAAPLLPCIPNSMVWLGWIAPFQLRLDAE